MPFSQNLLPEFDEEMKNTRKLLACVPDGKFDFRPHPKSMTLQNLAIHVAELPSFATMTLDTEVLEMGADYKRTIANTRAELLDIFDKCSAEARAKIAAATDQDWQVVWTFKYMGQVVMSMPRAAVVRSAMLNHLIHHRAQLGVYLRLNEVEFPGMYGPSADEMKLWETAKTA